MRLLPVLICLLAAGACGPGGGAGPAAVVTSGEGLLPEDGFLGAWGRTGGALVFRGADLFGHINGGAEVFLELGFDHLVVQDYSDGSDELVAEVYTMSDPVAAMGIYLMKCGREKPVEGLPGRHTVGRYQLQLVRGSVYLVVNNLSGAEAGGEAMVALAGRVAGVVPEADTSGVFEILPAEGRVPGSLRIVRGPFTLERVYTLGRGDMLQLGGAVTAVAADYALGADATSTVVAVDYPDSAAAAAAFEHAVGHLDPYLTSVSLEAGRLVFRDFEDLFGELWADDSRIVLRVRLAELPGGP